MKWIKINSVKDLPKEGKYVIAKHNRGTWNDGDDPINVNTVIVKLIRGISEKQRNSMKGTDKDYQYSNPDQLGNFYTTGLRSDTYIRGDEQGNNLVPYEWDSFGPDSFFGQNITHWAEIEPLP